MSKHNGSSARQSWLIHRPLSARFIVHPSICNNPCLARFKHISFELARSLNQPPTNFRAAFSSIIDSHQQGTTYPSQLPVPLIQTVFNFSCNHLPTLSYGTGGHLMVFAASCFGSPKVSFWLCLAISASCCRSSTSRLRSRNNLPCATSLRLQCAVAEVTASHGP